MICIACKEGDNEHGFIIINLMELALDNRAYYFKGFYYVAVVIAGILDINYDFISLHRHNSVSVRKVDIGDLEDFKVFLNVVDTVVHFVNFSSKI